MQQTTAVTEPLGVSEDFVSFAALDAYVRDAGRQTQSDPRSRPATAPRLGRCRVLTVGSKDDSEGDAFPAH